MNSKRGLASNVQGSDVEDTSIGKTQVRKTTTLFDAVAGRAGYESLLSTSDRSSKYRDTKSNSGQSIPPEEVLFKRKGAPVRYEENDFYFANERLNLDQELPDSDLLKHLHSYAANFYRNATSTGGKRDWKSMDETALLALGILLEETAAEHLGESGDLAFVEDEREDSLTSRRQYWNGERWVPSVVLKNPTNRSADL